MSYLADNPVPPAPAPDSEILFSISVDGTEAEVSDTHASLVAQSYRRWFFKDEAPGGSLAQDLFSIRLCAGARLHPDALAWLAWAAAATASDEVYADHDHLGEGTSERRDPILLPMPDRYWQNDLAKPRCVARRVGARGNRSAHVPLVLASYPANSRIHGRARAACEEEVSKISVIIPTRDNPKLLEKAVATLMSTARGAENIEIIVVDNSSSGKDTRDLFDSIAQRCNFQLVPFDAPFNWSRANNLGAKRARGNILLFLNDDTELRASNWNSILSSLLKDPMVGTVGARMLYPDGSIQHAGFVFGMDNGPQHEGRWMPGDCPGPTGRWLATRQAAAVTGAFMGIRRDTFSAVGGFDEKTFAIDFADVDFCLRLRSQGLAVLYCGAITLLHHESVSRGLNVSRVQRQRMRREAAALRKRWGAAVDYDPGYHPAWVRTGCSYDGLRVLSQIEVCEHVKLSVEKNSWHVSEYDANFRR